MNMSTKLSKRNRIPSLVINLLVFVVTTAVIVSYFFQEPGPLIKHNYETFRYFTTDSNILAAISCLILSVCQIRVLRGKAETIPQWAIVVKYVGTVSVMLTFMTVMCFLMPIYGLYEISGTLFHVHVSAPLMCLISFCVFEPCGKIRFRESLLGLLPTLIYGTVYMTQVVLIGEENGGWIDFYQFNQGGRWYISAAALLVATFVIGLLTALFHNAVMKRSGKKRTPVNENAK